MLQPGPRLLFALNEPGYFRLYGSTIVEMARRGWDVALVFDKPNRRGVDAQLPAGAGGSVRSLGALPDAVSPAMATLRLGLDYLRYLEPSFAEATYLRSRAEKHLPRALGFLARVKRLPRWVVSVAIALGRAVERVVPVSRAMLAFVREARPDVIVVSPVVIIGDGGVRQTELMKAGRALRIPVVVGVASWDHLTSKGLLRLVPDAVTVWNETQADEAVRLHRIPRSRVVVTGAQSLDHWFEAASPDAVPAFRRNLGIDDHRRVVLLVGSSANMAPGDSEPQFARRWLRALRASANAELSGAFVIVRPHPGNTEPWQQVDLGDPGAAVHPMTYSGMPLGDPEIETFRQSLLASDAVVGINTTAMIEAAILRKPVFSIRDVAFEHSQQQTLHFGYLSDDREGFVATANSMPEHVVELERLFTHGPNLEAADRFVGRFVRPLGMGQPATGQLCDVIERMIPMVPRREVSNPASTAEESRWTPSHVRTGRQ
ncbi:MAG: hypothetical protein ABL993_06295 [Vicinamibacterales bacterium]